MSFLDWNTITIKGTTPFGNFYWDSSSLRNNNTAIFSTLGGDFNNSPAPITTGTYPELETMLFGDDSVSNIVSDVDLIMNVKNTNSMDKMFDNLFFNSDDVPADAFNRTAIDWVDRIPTDISLKQQKFLAPLDPPIEPLLFPNLFSAFRKIGTSSFSYLSRFIKQKDSTEIVPQYKFKKPKKEDGNIPDDLFAEYADTFTEVVDVLNDFNPVGVNVDLPWDCGNGNVGCELVQLALEEVGGRKIQKFIDSHKNDTPTHVKELEDGTHTYIELDYPYSQYALNGTHTYDDLNTKDIDDIFSNSSNVIIENRPNGDVILNTQQNLSMKYEPIKNLPSVIKTKLVSTGTQYKTTVSNLEISETTAINQFNSAKSLADSAKAQTAIYYEKYISVVNRGSFGYSDPDNYRADVNKAYDKYIYIRNIEVAKSKDAMDKANKANEIIAKKNAVNQKRYDDIKVLLNSLIDDTCMNGEDIKQTVNQIFGDFLTDDAVSIFDEHIDKKKTETNCCLKVCINPCKYKLVKGS